MGQTSMHSITTLSLPHICAARLWTPSNSPTAASLWRRQHLLILWSSVEWLAPVMAVWADCLSHGVTGLLRTGKWNTMMLNQLLWCLHSRYLLHYSWHTCVSHPSQF
jgi:hypothetical protein